MVQKPFRVDEAEFIWRIWNILQDGNSVLGGVKFVDENGVPYGVKQVDNRLRISSTPYLYDIAKGLVSGHYPIRQNGFNNDVDITWETIYHAGGLRQYLTAAERLQVASDDADDTGAGNGARTVRIDGLDGDYNAISETVTMNGIANVTTDASFLRVLITTVITAGATGYNEGAITVSNFADTFILDQIDPQENRSHTACYTVPNGYTMYLSQIADAESSSKGSTLGLWIRPPGGLWTLERYLILLDNAIVIPIGTPIPILERSDVELRCKALLAGAVVSATMEGWIEAT